jgi:hypothetical protein
MFDEMLRQLGLPLAQYQHTIYEDCKVYVTVIFQTSKLTRQGSITHENIRSKVYGRGCSGTHRCHDSYQIYGEYD